MFNLLVEITKNNKWIVTLLLGSMITTNKISALHLHHIKGE